MTTMGCEARCSSAISAQTFETMSAASETEATAPKKRNVGRSLAAVSAAVAPSVVWAFSDAAALPEAAAMWATPPSVAVPNGAGAAASAENVGGELESSALLASASAASGAEPRVGGSFMNDGWEAFRGTYDNSLKQASLPGLFCGGGQRFTSTAHLFSLPPCALRTPPGRTRV